MLVTSSWPALECGWYPVTLQRGIFAKGYPLPIASWLGGTQCPRLPLRAGTLAWAHGPCACCQSLCEFISATVLLHKFRNRKMLFLGVIRPLWLLGSFCLFFRVDPWASKREILRRCPAQDWVLQGLSLSALCLVVVVVVFSVHIAVGH